MPASSRLVEAASCFPHRRTWRSAYPSGRPKSAETDARDSRRWRARPGCPRSPVPSALRPCGVRLSKSACVAVGDTGRPSPSRRRARPLRGLRRSRPSSGRARVWRERLHDPVLPAHVVSGLEDMAQRWSAQHPARSRRRSARRSGSSDRRRGAAREAHPRGGREGGPGGSRRGPPGRRRGSPAWAAVEWRTTEPPGCRQVERRSERLHESSDRFFVVSRAGRVSLGCRAGGANGVSSRQKQAGQVSARAFHHRSEAASTARGQDRGWAGQVLKPSDDLARGRFVVLVQVQVPLPGEQPELALGNALGEETRVADRNEQVVGRHGARAWGRR